MGASASTCVEAIQKLLLADADADAATLLLLLLLALLVWCRVPPCREGAPAGLL
jgi:hypothetical protein